MSDAHTRRAVWRRVLPPALVVASLIGLFGASLRAHVAYSGAHFNDDVCQHISPFLREVTAHPRDSVARYCLATLPTGYRALYSVGARVCGARDMSRVLTYLLFGVLVVALAGAAFRLQGWGAAWGCAALLLSGTVFLQRTANALPRGFAFPLFALAVLSVVNGWVVALGVVTVLAALFYPAMAVSSGLALALWLLVVRPEDRGEAAAWSVRRRIVVLALVAIAAAACTVPNAVSASRYGPMIGPAQFEQYPEAGPGGRFGPYERMDFRVPLSESVRRLVPMAFSNSGVPWSRAARSVGSPGGWSLAAGVIILVGGLYLVTCRAEARRLLGLTAASMVAYLVSRALAPHFFFPQRHIFYPGLALGVLWFSVAAAALPALVVSCKCRNGARGVAPAVSSAAAVVVCTLFLLARGGRVDARAGLNAAFEDEGKFHAFVSSLPEDSCLAGWPFRVSPIDYVCARPVFLSYETHLPFLAGYVDTMRVRMRMLIDAYFGVSIDPLDRLRDEGGVTHLAVESRHMAGVSPRYFKPYDEWIASAVSNAAGGVYATSRLRPRAVFDNGEVFVLDLSTIGEAPE